LDKHRLIQRSISKAKPVKNTLARGIIKNWCKHCNTKRPHSAFGHKPPYSEAIMPMNERLAMKQKWYWTTQWLCFPEVPAMMIHYFWFCCATLWHYMRQAELKARHYWLWKV